MKLLLLLFVVFCASSLLPLHAQEKFDYAATVALARERCPSPLKDEEAIFILGPEQNKETEFTNGKEIAKIIPFFRIAKSSAVGNIGVVFAPPRSSLGGGQYQILLYRSGQSTPALRVEGDNATIQRSQFPLKGGDVLVITETPKS